MPERYLRHHEEHGVFKELYRGEGLVHVPAPTLGGEVALPRVAVAVRAGDEFLGSVWAALRKPLTPEREKAFSEAAKLVALHMLRFRAGTDAENRLRADLVTTTLEGGAGAVEALGRLGLVDEPALVMAMGLAPGQGEDHAHVTAERQRLAAALAVHLTAVQPRSAVALLGDVAYALLPVPGDHTHTRERALQVAANFLQRTGDRTGAVIGIGSVAEEPAALPDRGPTPTGRCACCSPAGRESASPRSPTSTSTPCSWRCGTWPSPTATSCPALSPASSRTTPSTTPTWWRRCGPGWTPSGT